MKRILIPSIAFVVGVAIGIGTMVVAVQRGPNQVIADMAEGYISEQVIYGTLLFEKRYDDLQNLIENGLLTSLNFQKGLNLSAVGYRASQKSVRAYFDLTGRQVPALIDQQLQGIPQGSGSDLHNRADAAVAAQKFQ